MPCIARPPPNDNPAPTNPEIATDSADYITTALAACLAASFAVYWATCLAVCLASYCANTFLPVYKKAFLAAYFIAVYAASIAKICPVIAAPPKRIYFPIISAPVY